MLRAALLFIPAADPDTRKWMVMLWKYCTRRLYRPQAVVHSWTDVLKLMADGVADVVVVARRDHVDWLEVVGENPEPQHNEDTERPRRIPEGPE